MNRALVPVLAALLCASAAHAQTLSPGKLGKSHAAYEGITNCTKCHELGKKVDGQRCLECHEALKKQVDAKQGLHGRLEGGVQKCLECHHDHRGVDSPLTDYGAPTKQGFDHRRTGWPLEGKHAKAKCEACHDVRRVQDPALKKRFGADKPGTYLGLEKRCAACHFDEHRGQLQGSCDKCHDNKAFKPAPGFNHDTEWKLDGAHLKTKCEGCHLRVADTEARPAFPAPVDAKAFTRYALPDKNPSCRSCHFDEHRGQEGPECTRCHDTRAFKPPTHFNHDTAYKLQFSHTKVACAKCHPSEPDRGTPVTTPLKPVHPSFFMRFKPLEKQCSDCHKDVHSGKFGTACDKCHTEKGWQDSRTSQADPTFHDKSAFPLLGKHRSVECATCHPPAPKGGIQTKGFAFKHCMDCHLDAHLGQMTKDADGVVPCQRCHNENGFYPTRFPVADHQRGRYPLEGAHTTVACNSCHKADPKGFASQVPERLRKPGVTPKRNELLNFTRIRMPDKDLTRCVSCHQDPHGKQFAKKACTQCHQVSSFKDLLFSHDRDTRFPLVGAHTRAACASCHRPDKQDRVVYVGAPTRCDGCHRDEHLGQFRDPSTGRTECSRCHEPGAFKKPLFSHFDAQFSSFELRGKHVEVACAKCHPRKRLPDGRETAWYRGVPRRCDSCHVNVHGEVMP